MAEEPFLTESDLAPLVDKLALASEKSAEAMLVTSRQAGASMLVQALLVREMGRAGLIDMEALRAEAVARAEPLGEPMVEVVRSIFGGEPPVVPESAPQAVFRVIPGGRTEP